MVQPQQHPHLDIMVGDRYHGQYVQMDADHAPIPVVPAYPRQNIAATDAPLNANSAAQDNDLIIKAVAGILYGITVYSNGVAQWIQLFNANAAPADATVPLVVFEIGADVCRTFDFGPHGRYFSTGIYICNSTTDVTKTIGAANCIFDAQYR